MVDMNPKISAQMLVDKHIVKMPLESCQMLCTAHRFLDGKPVLKRNTLNGRTKLFYDMNDLYMNNILMQASYINHPCNIWVRESKENYMWLYEHYVSLLEEYTYRYEKTHSVERCKEVLSNVPKNIGNKGRTTLICSLSMKLEEYDEVTNYRKYYIQNKSHLFSWKKRNKPDWIR